MKKTTYGIIIDTEQYAGNFERELCAFLTGRVGDCGVGDEYEDENPLFENVIDVPDEDGCRRPCSIYPTKGWFNHGWGGNFKEGQEQEALEDYRKQVSEYYNHGIEDLKTIEKDLKAGKTVGNWTLEDVARDRKHKESEIEKAEKLETVNKYRASLSVVIYMDSPPTQEQIDYIKNKIGGFREAFLKEHTYRDNFEFTVTGIRTMKSSTNEETFDVA
jgi:hypothetical protein